ncbi:hypothetical protein, conserved [Eimeria acervulina]|uniref:Conserved oligomeric Golgi complex subunit 3 C-terminal domain-containing protein n=1 Tax=Eimeria acervulina TaxID=5801 RepID=U6GEY5_EIMAC|nr:hypothetical protein, conserved [Eimeria acervulina]CDI77114.1 hypothetical protein, conserved [Eimeria acervulina]
MRMHSRETTLCKKELQVIQEGIATATYDALCPAVLACNSVQDLSDIRDTLLLEMIALQSAPQDSAALLHKLDQLVLDIEERLFFRVEIAVEEMRRYTPGPQQLTRDSLLQQTYPPVLQCLHLVLLLQQRRIGDGSGDSPPAAAAAATAAAAAAAAADPFDAACSDVLAACLSSLDSAARAIAAAGLSLLPPAADAPPNNVEVTLLVSLFLIKNLTFLQ